MSGQPTRGRMSDAEFRRRILETVAERDEASARAQRERHRALIRVCAEVAVFVAEHPEASANHVCRCVTGRREVILEYLRALREAKKRFQAPRNQQSGGGG